MRARIKFHQFPGDIPKKQKIRMLEDRTHPHFGWLLKNVMRPRERAVLRERARQEIERDTP